MIQEGAKPVRLFVRPKKPVWPLPDIIFRFALRQMQLKKVPFQRQVRRPITLGLECKADT